MYKNNLQETSESKGHNQKSTIWQKYSVTAIFMETDAGSRDFSKRMSLIDKTVKYQQTIKFFI